MSEGREGEKSKSVGFSLDLVAAVTCEILYIGPHPRVDVSIDDRARSCAPQRPWSLRTISSTIAPRRQDRLPETALCTLYLSVFIGALNVHLRGCLPRREETNGTEEGLGYK